MCIFHKYAQLQIDSCLSYVLKPWTMNQRDWTSLRAKDVHISLFIGVGGVCKSDDADERFKCFQCQAIVRDCTLWSGWERLVGLTLELKTMKSMASFKKTVPRYILSFYPLGEEIWPMDGKCNRYKEMRETPTSTKHLSSTRFMYLFSRIIAFALHEVDPFDCWIASTAKVSRSNSSSDSEITPDYRY